MSKGIPRCVAEPLLRFITYSKESMRLLHLSMRGISVHRAMPNALKVLEDGLTFDSPESAAKRKEEHEKELKDANERAALAEKEVAEGFPLLHEHTLVGLWGAFQAAIEDSIIGMLVDEPALLQSESFSKVRIPLAEFETLDKEERMRLLIGELQRGQGLGRKQGIDAFETLLALVDLSGPVDEEIKRTYWEMHHVRNVIVHRGSRADRRLIQSCPWLGLKVGDKVRIDHSSLSKYEDALDRYLLIVVRRLCARYGVDVDATLDAAGLTLDT